jgi:transposase-like protein
MSDWVSRMLYARPEEERVFLVRELVEDATCPACSSSDVRRYPIANHQGPRMIVRCQECFHVLSLTRPEAQDAWPPYRSVAYDWEASPAERASRDAFEARAAINA